MAHNTKRSAARQAVETLERPEGISKTKWRGVKATLRVIAEHYPNPYPSQETIASLTGYDVRSIRRYVALAKASGLLLVKADAGRKGVNNSWSKTNRYLITIEDSLRGMGEDRKSCKPTGTTYPPGSELRSSHSPSEKSLSVIGISREEPSRQVGTAKPIAKPKSPPRRKQASDLVVASGYQPGKINPPKSLPWRRTAARFLSEWDSMVTATAPGDHLRAVRSAETLGHFQRYLNATFYGKEATTPKTEAEVADLIAQFMTDVFRGQIKIKSGQSAWMCFTGAWGRESKTVAAASSDYESYFKGKP